MKKAILMILGLVMMPMAAFAAPDFSGTWVADEARSEPAVNTLYWFGRLPNDPVRQPDITVEQDGNTLNVYEETRVLFRYAIPAVYIADGQERTVTIGNTGVSEQQMTAEWDDNKFVLEIEKPWGGMPGNATLHTREEWMLSPDGDTLYITKEHASPAKTVAYTTVYNRQ